MPEKKIKILTIFGTRKEFIKLYPVLDKLAADEDFESIVVTTSQYQEDFDDLYGLFGISPDHDLNLRRSQDSLSDITNLALSGLETLLKHHRPDLVVVQGESTTAFIGALAAFYNKIPVAHNGAGVRTFKKMKPYPAEVNRRMVSTLSDLHFAANSQNTVYLKYEGAIPNNIFITGDTIIDSIVGIARRNRNTLCKHMPPDDLAAFKTILVTSHLKETRGKPLENLCRALVDLTQAYPDIQIAFPLIFNSEVRGTVFGILKNKERIHLLDQLPYEAFVEAMGQAHIIITDSRCIMEEGLALKKPVLFFKESKEVNEEANVEGSKILGFGREGVVIETSRLLEDPAAYQKMLEDCNPHGDGHAAERIVQAIRHHFNPAAERPKDFQSPKPDRAGEDKKVFIKPVNSKAAQTNADAL
jgi:UDP-N-acetylglucosamine 2-epimerase (non-hydrolysing)